jgi:two-component system, NarL family, response regulator DevR
MVVQLGIAKRKHPSMKPIRVLIVDDHEMVREGLRLLLQDDPELNIVGEEANGQHILDVIDKVHPNVVLLDISLPGIDGIEVCRQVHARFPTLAVIMLTTYMERTLVEASLGAGARGYILKDVSLLQLDRIIKMVAIGESVIDPKILGELSFRTAQDSSDESKRPSNLSQQQLTILESISQGLSNKEIATQLSLSENTVKSYIQDILQKLEAKNRAAATMIALKNKWIA